VRGEGGARTLAAAIGVLLLLALPASASASAPLGLERCATTAGAHACSGTVRSWDGVPLDTTLTLPRAGARKLPLVVLIHGFGNSKWEYLDPGETAYTGNAFAWARRGYAVLTYTARGLWDSCGTPQSRAAMPGPCARGYIRLADVRYEVRDTQELVGRLVDAGVAAPRRIGVAGDSYGGGQSLMLAALRNRKMLPGGRLVRWRSPAGRKLRIAAAAPVIPWSDLVTAAAPNGRVSAVGVTGKQRATVPVGVSKSTLINGIFLAAQFAAGPGQPVGEPFVFGRPMGYLAPPGSDPEADVAGWLTRTDGGEPYTDPAALETVRILSAYHSAYYIDASRPPAPLLLAAGFTDDLFPVDESLRFLNRTNKRYPRVPTAALFGDFGHQRAANKPVERTRLLRSIRRWFGAHLKRRGRRPGRGVTAYVQTCPREAEPIGPFRARRFTALTDRKLRARFAKLRSIDSSGGDPAVGRALDPVLGGGDGCVETEAAPATGTQRYRIRRFAKPRTLIGAPRLEARLAVDGSEPEIAQIAGRLWDVSPDGRQRLVARGTYRPAQGRNGWQLHPGAWRFRRGHQAVLELLGNDAPFARPSNATFRIGIRDLRVTLPVR
jgi:predicted acyl esterase